METKDFTKNTATIRSVDTVAFAHIKPTKQRRWEYSQRPRRKVWMSKAKYNAAKRRTV
jgi:hypothetical protein